MTDQPSAPHGSPPDPPSGWSEPQGTPGYWNSPQTPTGPPPGYGQPQYGQPQYGQPQYGQPQYGQPQYGAPAGYQAPRVQPGIVPLRPLGFGEVFDGAFRSVRDNPKVMFGLPAIVVAVGAFLGVALTYVVLPLLSPAMSRLTGDLDPTGELASLYSLTFGTAFGVVPMQVVATTVLTGLLTASVSRSVIGQQIGVGEVWRTYGKRTLMLIPWSILLGLVQLIGLVALLAPGIAVLALGETAGGVVLILVGLVAVVVIGFWLWVRTLLVPPALVLEGHGLWTAVKRGWTLSRGAFWRIFGLAFLATIIVSVVQQIIAVPFAMVGGAISALNSSVAVTELSLVLSTILPSALGLIISLAFFAPVVALLYIDVRMRNEGLDIELARAAEAR